MSSRIDETHTSWRYAVADEHAVWGTSESHPHRIQPPARLTSCRLGDET